MSGRVVMLVTNPLASDSRVEKEAAALVSAGWDVVAIAWDRVGEHPAREEPRRARDRTHRPEGHVRRRWVVVGARWWKPACRGDTPRSA